MPVQVGSQPGRPILFIGNSLTYVNNLPGTLAALALASGDTLAITTIALPDFAVIDHALGLQGSQAMTAVRSQKWELVVLQQGPTPAGLDRDTLILAAKLFDPVVRASGGRIAALMTWPSASQQTQYPRLFDETRDTCTLEASAVNGTCYAAGEAWRAAWAANPALRLYGGDGYHPSSLGTYLTAIVLYEHITGRDARSLPGVGVVAGVRLGDDEATIRLLQRIAHETVATWKK